MSRINDDDLVDCAFYKPGVKKHNGKLHVYPFNLSVQIDSSSESDIISIILMTIEEKISLVSKYKIAPENLPSNP